MAKVKAKKKVVRVPPRKAGPYLLLDPYCSVHEIDDALSIEPTEPSFMECRRSEVTCAEHCPRLALFQYTYGMRKVARSNGMDQSSYAHITVALLLRGMDKDAVINVVDKLMNDVAEDTGDPTDIQHAKDANLGFAVGCYLHDQLADFVQAKGFIIRNVEERFEFTFHISARGPDGATITYFIPVRFQLDFVIENPKNGDLYIWDTKAIGTSPAELPSLPGPPRRGLIGSTRNRWTMASAAPDRKRPRPGLDFRPCHLRIARHHPYERIFGGSAASEAGGAGRIG